VAGDAGITARIVVVPRTTGVTVPSAALVVHDGGDPAVRTEAGMVAVTVKAASGGRVVVEGITVGTKVRVQGEDASR
jgi:hypothetical protein